MPKATSRTLAMIVGAGLLILAIGPAGAGAAPVKGTSKSLQTLVKQTNSLPGTAASKSALEKLRGSARQAAKGAGKGPCGAVSALARYRKTLRGIRVKSGKRFRRAAQRLAALGPASLKSSQLLLGDSRTKSCGGGVVPSTLPSAKTTIRSSDANGMTLRVELPAVRFVPRTGGGRTWSQLVLPNTDSPQTPGKPGIPVASSTFGVPDGATLSVDAAAAGAYTIDGVDVFPAQPEPADAVSPAPNVMKPPFTERPFQLSARAYKAKGLVPSDEAKGQILGTSRDLVIGSLQVPAAQYDAKARRLKVLSAVDVTVKFNGGPHTFSEQLLSPWERPQRRLLASLLNAAGIRPKIADLFYRCGEEMLVITNPATRPAADQFATARRAAGLRTSVLETGASGGQIGTTAAAIQSSIRTRLRSLVCIRPSYVTIMGDDDLVPTFIRPTTFSSSTPTDLDYSLANDADLLPDVAVGRILGNDQAAVATAVAKIIGYETTAPTGAFLNSAIVAAQFQDTDAAGEVNDGQEDRTFIQFAETVRNGLVNRGVAVDRIYEDSPSTTPLKFNDGTNLPASIKKPGFAWNGSGANVRTAWNAGRFLVVHRDHGWADGWSHPRFTTDDVNALSNGANLPVVMSINCASAAYDTDETSFAGEALVKANGGAVGVFGDTRDSPSWHNSQLALGFVDGLLPSVLPSEGPLAKQRTGDALINGKLRLAGLAPPAGDGNTRSELYLWHYFGDPSMQMWGGGSPPLVLDPGLFKAVFKKEIIGPPRPDPPPYFVEVTLPPGLAGQPISLLRNGEVIGKAIAGAGNATIPAAFGDGSVKPGELQIALEADGAQPVSAPVEVPADPPPPAPADLVVSDLTSSSITVKNQGAGPAGAFKAKIVDSQGQTLTFSFDGLPAGASASQQYDCNALLRQRTATVDSDGQVTESDETNNTLGPVVLACPSP